MGSFIETLACDLRADKVDAAFLTFRTAALVGSGARALLGRRIAFAVWPQVFDLLDFGQDKHFLEPLLFVGGVMPEILSDLPAILNPRPGSRSLICKPSFLPGRGYLDKTGRSPSSIPCCHGIEVLGQGIQGLQKLIGDHGLPHDAAFESVAKVIDLLAAVWPAMFSTLKQVCRRIVLFHSPDVNSFASDSMPGTVFVNLSQGSSLAALLEEVTHQAAHCLFSDIELATDPYLKPRGEALRDHGFTISAGRTISVLHHSCLTLAISCHALERALSLADLAPADRLEIQARIGFLCRKMALDLTAARKLDALTPEWQSNFWAMMAALRPAQSFDEYSYVRQGYSFNPETFFAENRAAMGSDLGPHAQQV